MDVKKLTASLELREFLQTWLDWAEGRSSDIQFTVSGGLCCATFIYEDRRMGNSYRLRSEMSTLFSEQNLSRNFPFGEMHYTNIYEFDQHRDPVRVSWVKAALEGKLSEWLIPLGRMKLDYDLAKAERSLEW